MSVVQADGRRQRSERSRQAIIDAALALMQEGVLAPTAQGISERAGVGIRSFFRHFTDMEALIAAVDDHIRAAYEAMFTGGDRSGELATRVKSAITRRGRAFDELSNLILGTQANLRHSSVLRQNYARCQRALRQDLESWIPELSALETTSREAVDAIASFEFWHRLRVHQRLSAKSSIELIIGLLLAVLTQRDRHRHTLSG